MIKFGTDGWRAVISEDFTFENVRIVAQAIAEYFNEVSINGECDNENRKIVVGYDTRFLSKKYAKLVSEIMVANEIEVVLTDKPSPTPAVSYFIKLNNLVGGVMITASHNPPHFNGIKVKADYGGSATPDITKKVESYINKTEPKIIDFQQAEKNGLVKTQNIVQNYIEFIYAYLNMDLFNKKGFELSVIVDVMYGTGDHFFDSILKNQNIKFKVIHDDLNPSFGNLNPEPIPSNLNTLSKMLKEGDYDIGIAIDGDSDRVGAMTSEGEFITPGWILSMLLIHFVEDKKMKGKVVKTISNSTLIEKIAQKYNLELEETPVGFKHICKIMQEENVLIGGEESGGIGFNDYMPERDGILAGLLLLEMMVYKQKNILQIKKEIEQEFAQFEYSRIDIEYPEEKKQPLFDKLDKEPFHELESRKIVDIKTYDGRKFICDDDSWLLFRLSGTEPKLRIYSEAHTKERVDNLLKFGRDYALNI